MLAVVAATGYLFVALAAPAVAVDVTPSPSPVAVTVVIPETSSPSPSPSTSPSSGGGAGGSSSSGGTTAGGELPTEALGAPIPPGDATANAGKLELDQKTISVNQWMVAIGSGFNPGENVQFVYYPGAIVIGSSVANSNGTVTARFRIPQDMRLGVHVVEATGWISKHVENEQFTLVSAAVQGTAPFLWWVVVVLGVLVVGTASLAIFFRHSIARWFGGSITATGAVP